MNSKQRCNLNEPSSPVANDWRIRNVPIVGILGVDTRSIVVAPHNADGLTRQRSAEWGLVRIAISGVAGKGAASVRLLVRNLLHLLANEVISSIGDAAVRIKVIGRVLWTHSTDSLDLYVLILAEAAAAEPKLVEAAEWTHESGARLVGSVVDIVVRALAAVSVDKIEAKGADAGLLLSGVGLVRCAPDENAGTVDKCIILAAAAFVVGGVVGSVFWAALADVLDDEESGKADAPAIEEVLVDGARVCAETSLLKFIIGVAFSAFPADSIDGVEASGAITVQGCYIEYLVGTAAIDLGLVRVLYFDCGSAVDAGLCVGKDCQKQQQEQRSVHSLSRYKIKNIMLCQLNINQFVGTSPLFLFVSSSPPFLLSFDWLITRFPVFSQSHICPFLIDIQLTKPIHKILRKNDLNFITSAFFLFMSNDSTIESIDF